LPASKILLIPGSVRAPSHRVSRLLLAAAAPSPTNTQATRISPLDYPPPFSDAVMTPEAGTP
jgi:hypothetical protein